MRRESHELVWIVRVGDLARVGEHRLPFDLGRLGDVDDPVGGERRPDFVLEDPRRVERGPYRQLRGPRRLRLRFA